MKHLGAAIWLSAGLTAPAASLAQETEPAPVPPEVRALAGCWRGSGAVLGKPVTIALTARSVAADALFLVEADSHAVADATDRYAAHLIFGGKTARPGAVDAPTISAFFADSFGGDFTSVGVGSAHAGGFEVAYPYPDALFVNRWIVAPDALTWTITARTAAGSDEAFAAYNLVRTACSAQPG